MELGFWWWVFTALLGGFISVPLILKKANDWFYTSRLGEKLCTTLPPGDMGWPLIGNMWFFLIAFKFGHPDSFISYFITRSLSLSLTVTFLHLVGKTLNCTINLYGLSTLFNLLSKRCSLIRKVPF